MINVKDNETLDKFLKQVDLGKKLSLTDIPEFNIQELH